MTPVTARSRVQCAGLCVAEVRCVTFCHNSVTLACFLDLGVSSDFGQESTDGRKCFTRIKATCPASEGYSLYSSRCLKLSSSPLTYLSAKDHCASEGGHLYYLKNTYLDLNPLALLIRQNQFNWFYWVGADAIGKSRHFTWGDGTPLSSTSELWMTGEPNNFYNRGEDCVCMKNVSANDNICGDVLWFVCEID
ncbi:macrophage mannose receptor 1-like [Pomacea canaliculata]|uniref:macrophage mannose receptor 1-like n=1 Tax=Pomacea canaliculata TaxID=400727 RepID=UPI000D729247|nr:macrophage mannose receptor 1-like [Pomacea canaliculata]